MVSSSWRSGWTTEASSGYLFSNFLEEIPGRPKIQAVFLHLPNEQRHADLDRPTRCRHIQKRGSAPPDFGPIFPQPSTRQPVVRLDRPTLSGINTVRHKMAATLKLFRESLTCKACGRAWSGLLHGFARGHTVLEKEGRILIIGDDIGYSFPQDFDSEYPRLFTDSGWRELESCPKCHSKRFSGARYDQSSTEEVPCIDIDQHDIARREKGWELTESGQNKIA